MSDVGGLRHKAALLHGIAEGVRRESKHRVELLEVVFHASSGAYEFTLDAALSALANDLYWDERGNWSDAATVEVRVL